MNRLHLLFSFLLIGFAAGAQTPSSCIPTATFTAKYRDDAKDMAVARLYAIGSPDTAIVEVPDVYTDSIMAGLAAVYNSATVESDSIFNNYCVHTTLHGFTRKTIMVEVDDSYSWTAHWAALHSTTGYTALDNFLSIHGFTVTNFYSWNKTAILTTDRVLNSKAFADSLEVFDGIWDAQEGYMIGDGDYIHYDKDTTTQRYTFRAGWGDCPAGCTASKTWVYDVDPFCDVTLVSATRMGSEPYLEMPNCSSVGVSRTEKATSFHAYPNPVHEMLVIDHALPYRFSLTDAYGRVVAKGEGNRSQVVNMTNMATGLYLLQVADEAGNMHVEKVVKE